jgi:hypothetical protein
MPENTWKGILDSIREKTGKTDLLTSTEVADEIANISATPEAVTFTKGDYFTYSLGNFIREDGYWFASSKDGIYRSSDGLTWEKIVTIDSAKFKKANGVWVVSSSSEGVFYTTDFSSLTPSNLTEAHFYIFEYHNGIWVGVTIPFGNTITNQTVYYSLDGKNWTLSESSFRMETLSYADGVWIASSPPYNDGEMYYSTDGINWQSSGTLVGSLTGIKRANGLWVIIGTKGSYYSTDGTSWNECKGTYSGANYVDYANGIWLSYTNKSGGGIYYSYDGINWARSEMTSESIKNIVYGNGMWVADGKYYSIDGKKWETTNMSDTFARLYYIDGLWLGTLTNYSASAERGLYYSHDGKTWFLSSYPRYDSSYIYYTDGMGIVENKTVYQMKINH